MIKSVAIDTREPAWIHKLAYKAPTLPTTLDTGDLWLSLEDGSLLVIERKTPNDFLNSIKDRRVFNQVAKAKELTPFVYVVITGAIVPVREQLATVTAVSDSHKRQRITGWNYAAVQGALMTLQELGAVVVFCAGDDDFLATVFRLANRSRGSVPIMPARTPTIFGGGEVVLASLPGIGPKKATDLMHHFPNAGSALWFLTDTDDNETKIPGIAEGTKENIVKALGGSLVFYPQENGNGK